LGQAPTNRLKDLQMGWLYGKHQRGLWMFQDLPGHASTLLRTTINWQVSILFDVAALRMTWQKQYSITGIHLPHFKPLRRRQRH